MPSTYTLNNGIELIATGEQSGTWGDTTNTNLQLLDTALDGQVTFTLTTAGSSGSPTALPIADGVSANSEGRNRLVIVNDGGDLGATAYVQLTPNDAEKIIYIRNDLSGSRSLILFQGTYSASRDYEVPAGTTAVVYFTGGGSGAAVAANVFNNAYFDSLRLGSVSVTAILDEDDMSSDSATSLATQQSIKAYVDSQVTAQDLDFAGDSGTGAVDLDSQTFTVAGTANEIETSASGQTLTVGLPDDVTVATSVTTTTIKTSNIDANDGTAAINIADSTGAVDIDTSLNVDGTITGDGLTIDGDGSFNGGFNDPKTLTFNSNRSVQDNILGKVLFQNTSNDVAEIYANSGPDGTDRDEGKLLFRTAEAGGTMRTRMRIDHEGDITFYDSTGSQSFVYDESAGVTINDQQAARDFTVKSDNNASMLVVDGTNDRVGVGVGSPTSELDVNGTITGDGLTIEGTSVLDSEANFTSATTSADKSLVLASTGATGGSGQYGASLAFSRVNSQAPRAAIAAVNTDGNFERMGLSFWTHVSNNASDPMNLRYILDHQGNHKWYQTDGSTVMHQWGYLGDVTFNYNNADANFLVKSQNQDYMLFVDAGEDRVGVGTNAPGALLDVKSSTVPVARLTNGEDKTWSVGNEIGVFEFYTTDASSPNGTKVAAEISSENSISSSVPSGELVFKTSPGGSSSTNAVEQARITSEGTFSLNGGNVGLKSDSTDTSSTTQTTIFSFNTGNTGAKFVVSVDDTTDTERYITELLVTHDGTTAVATEYGQVATNTALATFDVDISGGNVRLLATPASSNSMTFKVMSTTLA